MDKDSTMPIDRLSFALFVATAMGGGAFAQDGGVPLRDLDADRLDDGRIRIEFAYEGGACEAVGPAEPGEIVEGTLPVNFPTAATAEVCTMQVVEIEVDETVEADAAVERVAVTLLAPDGSVIGAGTAEVDDD